MLIFIFIFFNSIKRIAAIAEWLNNSFVIGIKIVPSRLEYTATKKNNISRLRLCVTDILHTMVAAGQNRRLPGMEWAGARKEKEWD